MSVPMLPPTTCRLLCAGAVSTQCQPDQIVSSLYQLVSSWLTLQSDKVTFSSDFSSLRKWLFGCFWIRSRIRAFNKLSEAELLLDLSQYIILFALHQFSSSHLHYKLKSNKVPLDLPLDRTRFLLIAQESDLIFAVCAYGMERKARTALTLWSLQSLSTSCGLLKWPTQGHLWPKSFAKSIF